MKKIILSLSIIVLILGILGFSKHDNKPIEINVIKENGYMVLAGDNNKDESTIVTKVKDNDIDKDGYVLAENVFDNKDKIELYKMNYRKGDIILITFYNDDIVKVRKNTLNIGNKVRGQLVK